MYYIVPAEIESRGEKVQRAYIKALSYGFVKVYRGRILVVGQQGAGKTCLKKNLLGLPFDANEKSTDGIQVDPSKVEIDVDQVKKWQSTGKNEQFLECSEAIAKFMIEKHPHEKDFRTIDCLLVKDKKEIDEEVLESNNDEEMEEDKGDSHMSQVCLGENTNIYLRQELQLWIEIVVECYFDFWACPHVLLQSC